jgi:protein gp37
MGITTIEWTDVTWNPTRGCSRVSEGCRECYAERQAHRFEGSTFAGFVQITNGHPQWTGKVELVEEHLEDPLHWRKPRRVFVNSMSDLFHEALSDEAIDQVFAVMALCPQHTFQVLTKRHERMLKWADRYGLKVRPEVGWPLRNVWLGVSVEDQKTADERIPLLLQMPVAVRFVSYEPALGPVNFNAIPNRWKGNGAGIDWVIVGGESGPRARPFDLHWALHTVRQCQEAGVACFVKQVGSKPFISERPGLRYFPFAPPNEYRFHDRKGGDPEEWPEMIRVRQFPKEELA